jgi:hypothetical protein
MGGKLRLVAEFRNRRPVAVALADITHGEARAKTACPRDEAADTGGRLMPLYLLFSIQRQCGTAAGRGRRRIRALDVIGSGLEVYITSAAFAKRGSKLPST